MITRRGEPAGARAEALFSAHPAIIVVGDFGTAEFSSAVARCDEGRPAFVHFDDWIARSARRQNGATV